MSRATFLRGLLVLPLVVPVVGAVAMRSGFDLGGLLPILGMSLLIGGAPYLAFSVVAIFLLRRASPHEMLRFICLAPLWFLIPLNLGVLCLMVYQGDLLIQGWWAPLLFFSAYGLAIGYLYVAIGVGLYRIAETLSLFPARRITSP